MNFVFITVQFTQLEAQLFSANQDRIRSVFPDATIVYSISRPDAVFDGYLQKLKRGSTRPKLSFIQPILAPKLACAATNRLAGWQFLERREGGVAPGEITCFLDGDMLITRPFLRYLKIKEADGSEQPTILSSDRMDWRLSLNEDGLVSGLSARRFVRPKLGSDGTLKTLFGAFAVRNIRSDVMLPTHDHEEQWLLANAKAVYDANLKFCKFGRSGIVHFDHWRGLRRIWRQFYSRRGVGYWQGLLSQRLGFKHLVKRWRYQGKYCFLLCATLIVALVFPYALVGLLFVPKLAKRVVWLVNGLIKFPFVGMAQKVEFAVL